MKNPYLVFNIWQVPSDLQPDYTQILIIGGIIAFLIILVFVIIRFVFGKQVISLKRKGIRVFISHAVADFDSYRIAELAKYLEKQKEISHVYFCETDLSGNIDDWMRKTVPRCQLLLFFSTDNSLKSADCINEIRLARKNNIEITPVLGVDSKWEDLDKVEIKRELGHEFKPMEFEKFRTDLYLYIVKFKHDLEEEILEAKLRK